MADEEVKVEVQNNTNEGGKKGKSIAALILSIISIVSVCAWYISLPCGIAGLILGILGRKSENAKGMALTGIILGALGSVIALIIGIIAIIAIIGMSSSSMMYY